MIRQLATACAAVIALALAPGAARAQPGPAADPATVAMTADQNSAVVLSLAQVLRERFAFRDRGAAAAREIEAMERQGVFRDARTAAELMALIDSRVTPVVNDRHFRVRYFGPEAVAGFTEGPPHGEALAAFHVFDPAGPPEGRVFQAEPRTPAYTDRPVYVLIDKETGSGAEEFAYDLQAMGRATLVGQTTWGGATPGGYRPLAEGFVAFIPMHVVTNTVTGANWEGVGVKPDVEVPADQALETAHRLAVEAVLRDAEGARRAIAEEGLAALGSQ